MALINCPECGKEISDKSPACIHCGYPIDVKDDNNRKDKGYSLELLDYGGKKYKLLLL